MSIPDSLDKIKGKINFDKTTVMYLFIIVGVGIGSFGLGRISVDYQKTEGINLATDKINNSILSQNANSNTIVLGAQEKQQGKRYVASKNGKMYYPLGCSGANRIKPENEVWFSTKEEAEKSGFTLSTTCK